MRNIFIRNNKVLVLDENTPQNLWTCLGKKTFICNGPSASARAKFLLSFQHSRSAGDSVAWMNVDGAKGSGKIRNTIATGTLFNVLAHGTSSVRCC